MKTTEKTNFFYIQVIHNKFLHLSCRYLVHFLIDYIKLKGDQIGALE